MHAQDMVWYLADYGARLPTTMTRTEIGDFVRQEFSRIINKLISQ